MPVSWWVAGVVLVVCVAAPSLVELTVWRRSAVDTRSVAIQLHNRRIARWLVAVVALAAAQVAVVAVTLVEGSPIRWLGGPGEVGLVVVVALLIVGTAAAVVARRGGRTREEGDVPTAWPLLVPVLLGAGATEVLFRGAMLAWAVASPLGTVGGVALSALAFGATRAPRGWSATIAATVAGAVFGVAVVSTGWVVVAVLAHPVLLLVVAAVNARGRTAVAAGGACGGHDPNSPACAGCPLAPAAGRRTAGAASA